MCLTLISYEFTILLLTDNISVFKTDHQDSLIYIKELLYDWERGPQSVIDVALSFCLVTALYHCFTMPNYCTNNKKLLSQLLLKTIFLEQNQIKGAGAVLLCSQARSL